MQSKHWQRLEKAEAAFQPEAAQNGVVIFPLNGESDDDYAARIERWKAGEEVDGVDRPYDGSSRKIGKVRFVRAEAED